MSEDETFDILDSKPSGHVTTDEVKKKEDRTNIEAEKPPDEDNELQDKGSSAASELKAESSEKSVGHELQIDSGGCSLHHVELYDGHGENKAQIHGRLDINDKISDISLSSKQEEEEVLTQVVHVTVQNQPPPHPSHEHLSPSPNTVHIYSSDSREGKTRALALEHKDVHSGTMPASITETYDVISKKDIQGFDEWESIHKDNLSEIPPIDPGALRDIERRAREVASNLDHLMGTLAASLKAMSVTGVQSIDTYMTTVENVEVTVDASIKSMCTLIAKCKELHSYMGPLYSMSAQIKDIKRTLDVFESVCK